MKTEKRECPHCHGSLERYEDPVAVKMLEELHVKDSVRTKEHNILTQENRALIADRGNLLKLLTKTMNVISEYGQITDESRVGWLMVEIDAALGKHGLPAEASAEPANKWIAEAKPLLVRGQMEAIAERLAEKLTLVVCACRERVDAEGVLSDYRKLQQASTSFICHDDTTAMQRVNKALSLTAPIADKWVSKEAHEKVVSAALEVASASEKHTAKLQALIAAKDEALKWCRHLVDTGKNERSDKIEDALSLTPPEAAKMFVPVGDVKPLLNTTAYAGDTWRSKIRDFLAKHGDKLK